eukprot:CAMPEP_0172621056 /NCGR_PEP_ID=MMETSP1068-20121228/108506_1 /TAXON_ID=35684 /ORGANISM="Pseudopedinella elastica, Strain CCMP716" /LENGTH=66 /DNA_ID=CAMNT_0013428603 /DNA_START=113 /DNA_END=309 /DNA_ORIENTATION=-
MSASNLPRLGVGAHGELSHLDRFHCGREQAPGLGPVSRGGRRVGKVLRFLLLARLGGPRPRQRRPL